METIIVTSAAYIKGYLIKIEFSDKTSRVIDFEPFLRENKHPQWDKYNEVANFRKFRIENGNLVWGRNWDLIFPISGLYSGNLLDRCC
jgi:hypothetical protein